MHPALQVIIAIAAMVYILGSLQAASRTLLIHLDQRKLNSINEVHNKATKEIEPSFDLWWEQGPKEKVMVKCLDEAKGQFGPLADMVELPKMLEERLLGGIVSKVKSHAKHVALHAYVGDGDTKLVNGTWLTQIGKEEAQNWKEEHEEVLNRDTNILLEYGVDVDAMQKHFSKSSA